jgi:hypothetical protein
MAWDLRFLIEDFGLSMDGMRLELYRETQCGMKPREFVGWMKIASRPKFAR